jgi:signal transduction histidine kinase
MPSSLLTCAIAAGRPHHPSEARSGPGGDDGAVDAHLQQAQRLAAAGRLASGLVHDFNNVLLVVAACLDQIASAPDDAPNVEAQARLALEAVGRASAVARQLATYGGPNATPGRSLVDLNDIVLGAARLVRPIAGAGVEVAVTCQTGALPSRVDPGQVEQALINLCLNACDAMPDGGTLRVSTGCALRADGPSGPAGPGRTPHRYAVVEVADTGIGIPAAAQPFVFEPFFTTKPQGAGSGLGLAMVRDIARRHGGFVEFSTEPGAGTMFRLLLPHG